MVLKFCGNNGSAGGRPHAEEHRSKGDAMSKNWQIVTKRERERAVEQKRTLKRERKRAAAAEKAAQKAETAAPESPGTEGG